MSTISILQSIELPSFWQVFSSVLKTQFPGYSEVVINFLLNKIYHQYAFSYWLDHNDKTILITKENNTIVGFAVIDKPYGGVSFCRWLGVLPKHQRRGVGKQLVDFWIDIATTAGCHKLEVAAQLEAKDFYEKIGLEFEGVKKNSYFGIDLYSFGKTISKPNAVTMSK